MLRNPHKLILIVLLLLPFVSFAQEEENPLQQTLSEASNRHEKLRALNNLVNYFRDNEGDSAWVYASTLLSEAFSSIQTDTDTFEVGLAYSQMAKTLLTMDSLSKAEEMYALAEKWFRAGQYLYQIPDILIDLGQIQLQRGELEKARIQYHEARRIAKIKCLGYGELGDELRANAYKDKWAHAEYALADVFMLDHQKDSVLPYLETALKLYEELDYEWGIANCQYTRAQYVREFDGNYADAFNDLMSAIDIFQYLENRNHIGYTSEEIEKLFAQADKDLEISRLRYLATGGGLVLIFIIAGILFVSRQRLRAKNRTIDFYRRELQHRFGNNLQMLENLMHLQLNKLQDERAKDALRSSISRIEVIFNLLKQFYHPGEVNMRTDGKLDLKAYLEKLVDQLAQVVDRDGTQVDIRRDISSVEVSLETARSISLVVNECLTNATKYAFPFSDQPRLDISLKPISDKQLLLTIADNGPGMPIEAENHRPGSFGLSMVNMLVKRQLKGNLSIDNKDGTHISITFPIA